MLADTLVQTTRESNVMTAADLFLEKLETQLTPSEFVRAREALELYCEFNVSREIIKYNPFKPVLLHSVTNDFVSYKLQSDQTSTCKKEIENQTYEKYRILLQTQLDTRLKGMKF